MTGLAYDCHSGSVICEYQNISEPSLKGPAVVVGRVAFVLDVVVFVVVVDLI